jgi:hypothetical protein
MLIHAGGDERVRDLHQKSGRPAKEEKALAVDATSDAIGREEPDVSHLTSVR